MATQKKISANRVPNNRRTIHGVRMSNNFILSPDDAVLLGSRLVSCGLAIKGTPGIRQEVLVTALKSHELPEIQVYVEESVGLLSKIPL